MEFIELEGALEIILIQLPHLLWIRKQVHRGEVNLPKVTQ